MDGCCYKDTDTSVTKILNSNVTSNAESCKGYPYVFSFKHVDPKQKVEAPHCALSNFCS